MWSVFAVLLVGLLPGALIFRLPVGVPSKRASLPAEERLFWAVMLSMMVSSVGALVLAAGGWYRFDRLLWLNAGVCVAALLVPGTLRRRERSPLPTTTALIPAMLLAAGLSLTCWVPPAEYIMGGKDPGVYMNEGIQIAQRGSLITADSTVAGIPPIFRSLFFARPPERDALYFSNRFMGFFLLNPDEGTVVGQFPHLYPVWIAIAYGIHGLTGARWIVGLSGALGLLAVYFAGARMLNRAAAAAGAGLLAIHVVQVWYGRYPNAELVLQPLVFGALLAYVRVQQDDDGFFAPVAGLLAGLSVFAHLTGILVVIALIGVMIADRLDGRLVRRSLAVPIILGGVLGVIYLMTFLAPYFDAPLEFAETFTFTEWALLALAALAAAAGWQIARRPSIARTVRDWLPTTLASAVVLLAGYAYFIRSAGGLLAIHDADALRTFTSFYLFPLGLAAALVGFVLVARRSFSVSAPLLILVAAFSVVFFYKIRIVPEHFWAARRFVGIILPGALLLVGAAAFSSPQKWRIALGTLLVLILGARYAAAVQPILRHVEYAGLIPRIEQLNKIFGSDDLVLVESRGSSDLHVLALPLAYIYDRHVVVFAATNPNKALFRTFLAWARDRYDRIFFVGGGGTELLSRSIAVQAVTGERFQIPEYASTMNAYPEGVRYKEFDFTVYEFLPDVPVSDGFDLDVGSSDDLYLRRFHAKERTPDGLTFRWTRDVSHISIVGTGADQQQLTIWMGDGGRPASAPPADVSVAINGEPLGTIRVAPGVASYVFTVPPALAASLAESEDAADLVLATRTWNPARDLGGGDTRDLGVIVDRVALK